MNNTLPSPSQPPAASQLFLSYLTQYGTATVVLAAWASRAAQTEMDVTIAACVTGVALGVMQFATSRALAGRSQSTQLAVNAVISTAAAALGCWVASAHLIG